MKHKRDTHRSFTLVVEEALQSELLRVTDVMARTGLAYNRVTAALAHLKKHQAVESIEVDGETWWSLDGTDTREFQRKEVATEEPGSRHGRGTGRRSSIPKANPYRDAALEANQIAEEFRAKAHNAATAAHHQE